MADNKWEVVSGLDAGLTENHVVCFNLETGEKRESLIRGHNMYVRKCERPEDIGGILITEKSRQDNNFALVLAVGTECGKFRKLTKVQKKMKDMRSSVVLGVSPNDRVLGPDDHPWAITRSPWRHNDFFIDECAIIGVLPSEE